MDCRRENKNKKTPLRSVSISIISVPFIDRSGGKQKRRTHRTHRTHRTNTSATHTNQCFEISILPFWPASTCAPPPSRCRRRERRGPWSTSAACASRFVSKTKKQNMKERKDEKNARSFASFFKKMSAYHVRVSCVMIETKQTDKPFVQFVGLGTGHWLTQSVRSDHTVVPKINNTLT